MYIVNGKKVEYIHIVEEKNGDIIVEYDEIFNLVKAHMGVIMQRLYDNDFTDVHVFKNLKYRIITIQLHDIAQLHGVLYALSVPPGTYEILYDDEIVVIDTPEYERAIGVEHPVTLTKKEWLPYR